MAQGSCFVERDFQGETASFLANFPFSVRATNIPRLTISLPPLTMQCFTAAERPSRGEAVNLVRP